MLCLQRQGRLPWVTSSQDQRVLSLSKYGIKVMDEKRQRVFARHALHFIVNITYYEDTYRKHMIAVRVGRPDVATFDLYIYECVDEVSWVTKSSVEIGRVLHTQRCHVQPVRCSSAMMSPWVSHRRDLNHSCPRIFSSWIRSLSLSLHHWLSYAVPTDSFSNY